MYLLHSIESGKVNHIEHLNRIISSIYSASGNTNVTVTHMIRISIFFLAIFLYWQPNLLRGQDLIHFQCYNLDSISWDLDFNDCVNPQVDSFQIFTRANPDAEFHILLTSHEPLVRGIRHDVLKTHQALVLKYFYSCPDARTLTDTIQLSLFREPVQINKVEVLSNGNVKLAWETKPLDGIRYIVNAAVGGSSQVLATNLRENTYIDTRGLAAQNIEYYSISAVLDCGYTIPEPDSFFHTSHLSLTVDQCGGAVTFDFTPFSYWTTGTSAATLFVVREGHEVDSLDISVGERSFVYDLIDNDQNYTFYVREEGSNDQQRAYSNPVSIHTSFYEPIEWITIDDFSFDEFNRATISWKTNPHTPDSAFQLSDDAQVLAIPSADLITHSQPYRYGFELNEAPGVGNMYQIMLQDSCENAVTSRSKTPLFTQGNLTSNNELRIQWTDVSNDEWMIHEYEIHARTQGSFTSLGTVDGSTFQFDHAFESGANIDSVCYYVTAAGEVLYPDGVGTLSLRSNTVCLFGETIVEIPNAHSSYQEAYKPIVVPKSNLTSYVFRIFDRYGSLVFETENPDEGWNGRYQGKMGFSDVFVVQVEITNSQGELIEKTGSLVLFP